MLWKKPNKGNLNQKEQKHNVSFVSLFTSITKGMKFISAFGRQKRVVEGHENEESSTAERHEAVKRSPSGISRLELFKMKLQGKSCLGYVFGADNRILGLWTPSKGLVDLSSIESERERKELLGSLMPPKVIFASPDLEMTVSESIESESGLGFEESELTGEAEEATDKTARETGELMVQIELSSSDQEEEAEEGGSFIYTFSLPETYIKTLTDILVHFDKSAKIYAPVTAYGAVEGWNVDIFAFSDDVAFSIVGFRNGSVYRQYITSGTLEEVVSISVQSVGESEYMDREQSVKLFVCCTDNVSVNAQKLTDIMLERFKAFPNVPSEIEVVSLPASCRIAKKPIWDAQFECYELKNIEKAKKERLVAFACLCFVFVSFVYNSYTMLSLKRRQYVMQVKLRVFENTKQQFEKVVSGVSVYVAKALVYNRQPRWESFYREMPVMFACSALKDIKVNADTTRWRWSWEAIYEVDSNVCSPEEAYYEALNAFKKIGSRLGYSSMMLVNNGDGSFTIKVNGVKMVRSRNKNKVGFGSGRVAGVWR